MTGSTAGVVPVAARTPLSGMAGMAPDRMTVAPGVLSSIAGSGQRIKPPVWGPDGTGTRIVGLLGDAIATTYGGQPIYAQAMQNRQDHELSNMLQRMQINALQRKASQPNIEHFGDAVGILDPDTGGFTPTYTAPTDAERYAMAAGATRGTPEWMTALQDYTLRGRGPTSAGFADDLEDTRQDNRIQLEGVRQQGRVALKGVGTFGQLHPRMPGGTVPGGFVGGRNSPAASVSTADLLKHLGG